MQQPTISLARFALADTLAALAAHSTKEDVESKKIMERIVWLMRRRAKCLGLSGFDKAVWEGNAKLLVHAAAQEFREFLRRDDGAGARKGGQ